MPGISTAAREARPLSAQLARSHAAVAERLLELWAAIRAGDPIAAGAHLHAFAEPLERQLGAEEALLYPAFAAHTLLAAAVDSQRTEHRLIEDALRAVERALAACRLEDAEGACGALATLVGDHHLREHRLLELQGDELLAPDERDALVVRLSHEETGEP